MFRSDGFQMLRSVLPGKGAPDESGAQSKTWRIYQQPYIRLRASIIFLRVSSLRPRSASGRTKSGSFGEGLTERFNGAQFLEVFLALTSFNRACTTTGY